MYEIRVKLASQEVKPTTLAALFVRCVLKSSPSYISLLRFSRFPHKVFLKPTFLKNNNNKHLYKIQSNLTPITGTAVATSTALFMEYAPATNLLEMARPSAATCARVARRRVTAVRALKIENGIHYFYSVTVWRLLKWVTQLYNSAVNLNITKLYDCFLLRFLVHFLTQASTSTIQYK